MIFKNKLSNTNSQLSLEMHRLPVKNAVLITIAIVTNMIALIVVVITEYNVIYLVSIGVVIVCVFFITKYWKNEYNMCCSKIEDFVVRKFEKKNKILELSVSNI